ncbi:signal peptide peptidase SppA [Helicobacter sp. 16-1353]|uniref:signal peptide peptidase SppA n=1 Tax=Helicobacter sp. 16-1353 TaxID=2004996 RepID=UPI0026D3333C
MKTIKKIFGIFIVKPLEFIQKYFKTFVFLFIVVLIISSGTPKKDFNANLAKIYLKGPIFESETFMAQIENLKNFPNLKGILLIIDSPGGALASSVEIADMVKELNESIPIVTYVQGAMASGSYYAGMYAHTIVANRGAMIGSIGVIMNGYNIKDLMDKIGIQSQSLKAGEYKEAGTITRQWSDTERIYLQNMLDKQYKMFINDVANARNLDVKNYKNFAEGKIFNSYDALNLGLIDLVGTQINAINILKELSNVKDIVWVKQGIIDSYLKKMTTQAINQVFYNLTKIQ